MKAELEVINGKYKFEVSIDPDGYEHIEDCCENDELIRQYQNDEINVYIVTKEERCECCNQYNKLIDVMSGFICESAEVALEQFIECVGA